MNAFMALSYSWLEKYSNPSFTQLLALIVFIESAAAPNDGKKKEPALAAE
ncbi:MAG: hypothetical protein KKH04_22115 [Proteobacteria bacterium]|nr:hypothetical protein [Pseudomonadota bacterium]